MSHHKAVFLDRDGTIARDVQYCSRVEDFVLFPGAPGAIRMLNEKGFKVLVITNQSGIARGFFSEDILSQIHQKMTQELLSAGARLDGIYYCSHKADDGCGCRKPEIGLFQRAVQDFDIDLASSCVVGDSRSDIEAGKKLGCKTVLVTTGLNKGKLDAGAPSPDFVAQDLLAAARWIVASANHIPISVPEPSCKVGQLQKSSCQ